MNLFSVFVFLVLVRTCHQQYRQRALTLVWGPNGLRLHPQQLANSFGLDLSSQYTSNPYLMRLAGRVATLQQVLRGRHGRSHSFGRAPLPPLPVPAPSPPLGGVCDQLYITNQAMMTGEYDAVVRGRMIRVYCQIQVDDHNWLVIQHRENGAQNFQQTFDQYKAGFGTLTDEFFMGLDNLADITQNGFYILRVDLRDNDGNEAFAEYSHFKVLSESTGYRLFVRGYSGTAGDSLSYHSGLPFSTTDMDRDTHFQNKNCAMIHGGGGWWYRSCMLANLNGVYITGGVVDIQGIVWFTWKNHESLTAVTMRLRAKES